MWLLPLIFAAGVDGGAALRHASALAALGPHPWGSPRTRFAAQYVAAELRQLGVSEVRLQDFESHGLRGANVIGVLRGASPETILIGAHHDTAPAAPGAYDDGGGVGILLELARVLAAERERPRTLVLASFDAEEAESQRPEQAAGSKAFVQALGKEAANLVGAIVIEMSGQKGGEPVLHTIAYADPLRPGSSVVAPGWLVAAALSGAAEAGAPLRVGDRLLAWVYQPAVRFLRVRLYGDDISFLRAGLPAVFVSDSSLTRFYPWYHAAGDTADKLDAGALERTGRAVLGAVRRLERVERGPAVQPSWFALFGLVIPGAGLGLLGVLALLPGLSRARSASGPAKAARAMQALLFLVLLWWHPVPALWLLALPTAVLAFGRSRRALALALLPLLALAGMGVAGYLRGAGPEGRIVAGFWPSSWELAAFALALGLLFVPLGPSGSGPKKVRLRGPSRRGLPR
ncbi:MAG: M28 family metallopeptidase [Vicinamibacteria bacterium]